MLCLLGCAGDASGKGLEEVSGVCCGGGNCGRQPKAWKDVLPVEAGAPHQDFSIVRGDGETTLFHLSLVDYDAPKGEQFNVSIDDPLVEILIPAMLTDVLLSSRPRGEVESSARIALQRMGAGKKELRLLRLDRPWRVAVGVGRAAKSSTIRQLVMSRARGTVTWMGRLGGLR